MKGLRDEPALFDLTTIMSDDELDFRRRDWLVQNSIPHVEEGEITVTPRLQKSLSSISLRVLASLNLPLEVVTIVEANIGWPAVNFGGGHDQVVLTPEDRYRELERLAQAIRDIDMSTWTADVSYVMQNLELYNALVRGVLGELDFFRGMRPRAHRPLEPGPGLNDLSGVVEKLEALTTDLDETGCLVVNISDQDEHIPTLQQLIRFLR